MADDKNRQEEANRVELGRRKAATRGTRQQTGSSNAVSNGMSARSMLSLNKSRDNKTSSEEKIREKAGAAAGRVLVGAAAAAAIPGIGALAGEAGAVVGKKVAKSWVGKIIFWGVLFMLFFTFFVLAATVVAVICNTGTVGRWGAWWVGVALPACKL